MTIRQYIVIATTLTVLLFPVTIYPHGHPLMERILPTVFACDEAPRSIAEAYGTRCFTALGNHFSGYPAASMVVVTDRHFYIGPFIHDGDIGHIVEHVVKWHEMGGEKYSNVFTEAHRPEYHGSHIFELQAKAGAQGFRLSLHGRACR